MHEERNAGCPDCSDVSRRDFVRVLGGTAIAAAPLVGTVAAAKKKKKAVTAETAVTELYATITETQKKMICFGFDHALRKKINANWAITKPSIGDDFYTKEQRVLIDRIVRGVTSEDGYGQFMQQMEDDAGGFSEYHIAIFGKPGTGKFEFELTGRHLTLRADGDSVDNVAFGGPIVYGHGIGNPKKNLYHYQTKQANTVFAALDAKQAKQALLPKAPPESRVPIQGKAGKFPGISVGSLSSDQRDLVEKTIKVILSPYREADVDEALKMLKAGGGLGKLHMAFYQAEDLDADKVWDIWRLEGPSFVWHFRGAPHVHTYVNIGLKNV